MSASALTGYQRVREEAVALGVELEERSKVCELLQAHLKRERELARHIEDDVAVEFEAKINDAVAKHKEELGTRTIESNELMEQKRGLVEACKHWVAEVAAAEQVIALDLRRVRAESEAEVDRDRRAFKAGAEDRRNRALARRQQEIKDETRRAMEPEFQRLRRNHDAQMQELNVRLAAEERALRDSYEAVLAGRIAEEERALKAAAQTRSRQLLDSATCDNEAAEASHRDEMRRIVRDAKAEIESKRASLQAKLESEKTRLKSELLRVQQEGQAQLDALAASHRREVERAHAEHDELVQQLKARDAAQREAAEKDFEVDARVIRMQQEQLLRSPKKEGGSRLPPEVQAARDERLHDEIKKAETETVRQLRHLKARVEAERSSIVSAAEAELAARLKRRLKFENEAADLSSRKEEQSNSLKAMRSDLRSLEARRADADRELEALLDSLNAAEAARLQKEEAERKRLQSELSTAQGQVNVAEARLGDLERQLQDMTSSQTDELDSMEINCNKTLEELDANVKRDVQRLEDEAEELRDAVQTERVRCERLRKILRGYGGAAGSANS